MGVGSMQTFVTIDKLPACTRSPSSFAFCALAVRCLLVTLFVFSASGLTVLAQSEGDSLKIYRGSIGDKHIQMKLRIEGSKVTGTYFYDQYREDLKLEGGYNSKGQLELSEAGAGKRTTGKFICEREPKTFGPDVECEWSRPDGTGQALVVLYDQHLALTKGFDIVPKIIVDRKAHVTVSYPQLVGATTPAVTDLNSLITSFVQKSIKAFNRDASGRQNSFDANYNVLMATDEIVSIEMEDYSDTGGAYPNTGFWTLNYDLQANKQLDLQDIFQPKADFKTTIAAYVARDINRRAEQIEREEARREGRKPEKRDEPVMTAEQLPQIHGWALSSKGLAIYFDFPHAIAVFDKTIVPYSVVRAQLRLDGPAAQFLR
jgi:Deacetylase PdaC